MPDMERHEIGRRVEQSIPTWMTHKDFAAQVDMATDALSQSLNGNRPFSAIELAEIAEVLDEDVHWFITGEPDPLRAEIMTCGSVHSIEERRKFAH